MMVHQSLIIVVLPLCLFAHSVHGLGLLRHPQQQQQQSELAVLPPDDGNTAHAWQLLVNLTLPAAEAATQYGHTQATSTLAGRGRRLLNGECFPFTECQSRAEYGDFA